MAAKAGISAAVSELSTLHEDDLKQRILARPRPRHVAVIMDGNGRWATKRELPELMERNVRFRVIGRADGVPARVGERIQRLIETTSRNTGLTLLMAFNYGGRDELVDAVRALAREVLSGQLRPEDIDEVRVSRALYTDGITAPDLLIRTSGELRLSNFLLWQVAYTELWMTPTLWPDFGAREFCLAIADFQQRDRRFGKV